MISTSKMNDQFEHIVIPMLNMFPKLVLTGSISLELLGLLNRNTSNQDIDFSLTEKLTEDELNSFINFFNLDFSNFLSDYSISNTQIENPKIDKVKMSTNEILNCNLIQLLKFKTNNDSTLNIDENLKTKNGSDIEYKVDIFNKVYIDKADVFNIKWHSIPIRIQNPAITWSYKTKIGLEMGGQNKHITDLKELINNEKKLNYYNELMYKLQLFEK